MHCELERTCCPRRTGGFSGTDFAVSGTAGFYVAATYEKLPLHCVRKCVINQLREPKPLQFAALQYMRTPLISVVLPDENQRLLLGVSITPSEHDGFLTEDSPEPPPARFSVHTPWRPRLSEEDPKLASSEWYDFPVHAA